MIITETLLVCDHCGARGEPSQTSHLARQMPGWGTLEYRDPDRRYREPKRVMDLCPICLGRVTEPREVRGMVEVVR